MTFIVAIDVCMFGAPWRKPTTLAANFDKIMRLFRKCDGFHVHISLQGNAPCGRSWTAVASPYWQDFARTWVWETRELLVEDNEEKRQPLPFVGLPSVEPEMSVDKLLSDTVFEPPRGV